MTIKRFDEFASEVQKGLAEEGYDNASELGAEMLNMLDQSRRITPLQKRALRQFLRNQNSVRQIMHEISREAGNVDTGNLIMASFSHHMSIGDTQTVSTSIKIDGRTTIQVSFDVLEDTGTVVNWKVEKV